MEGIEERDKLYNFRPLLFVAFFLALGITYAYFRIFHEISPWWLLCLAPAGVCVLAFSYGLEDFFKRLTLFLLLLAAFSVGGRLFSIQLDEYADCRELQGEYIVIGTVENRKHYGDYTRVVLRDLQIGGKETEGRLNAYLPIVYGERMQLGDRITTEGTVTLDTETYNEYGFRSGHIRSKTRYRLSCEEYSRIGRSKNPFLRIRARMERVVYAGMDEDSAALTMALLTGDSTGVDEELNDNMRYGGISHIFAVSGLNVGALYLFFRLLFAKTGLVRAKKWVRFALMCVLLLFYAGVCGFTASVMRATLFSILFYFTRLLGTRADPLEGLGFSAIVILLVTPTQLFDVGFQLSYLACFGLFLLNKPIGQVFDEIQKRYRVRHPRKLTAEEEETLKEEGRLPPTGGEKCYAFVKNVTTASLAAQLATLPALICHFGYISGWSMLLNFIFVPLIDGIFTFLLAIVAIACLLPVELAGGLLYLPSALWSAGMLVFELYDFSSFRLKGVQVMLGLCVCYYGELILLSDKLNLKKWARWYLLVACAVSLSACFLLSNL